MIKATTIGALSAMILASVCPASAATLVDTGLSPYNGMFGIGLHGFAGKFTAPDSVLTSVEAGVSDMLFGIIESPFQQSFHIAIYEGSGEVPGAELFSRQISFDGSPAWHGASGLNWAITAGDYFVAAEVRQNDICNCIMSDGVPFPLADNAWMNRDGSYGEADAFAFAFRVRADTGVVPEPASWAMLITGFGLTGAALRRRRTQATT